jgi:hypothetical protein
MWIFTRYEFYSVVQGKMDPYCIQVRARIKDDLKRLSEFARKSVGIELPGIISTDHTDYACRIILPKTEWLKVAAALASDIDYTNFKNEVHGEADRDQTYLKVWSAMYEFQGQRSRQDRR